MINTNLSRMIVGGENFPEDRMIEYTLHLPVPPDIKRFADGLAKRAIIEEDAGIQLMSLGDSVSGFISATKEMDEPNAQWIDENDVQIGWSDENALQLLSMQLAAKDLTPQTLKRTLPRYEIEEHHLLDAAMYPGALVEDSEEYERPAAQYGDLVVQGFTTAPIGYFDLAEEISKTAATNDDKTIVVVGNDDYGIFGAKRDESSGVWEVKTNYGVEHSTYISADKNALEVAREMCCDLAVFNLSADEVFEQIQSYGMQSDSLELVEVFGTPHVIEFDHKGASLPDPEASWKKISGQLDELGM